MSFSQAMGPSSVIQPIVKSSSRFLHSRPRKLVHLFLPPQGLLSPWDLSGSRKHCFGGLCAPSESLVLTAETSQLNYGQKFFSPLLRDSTCDLVCCVDLDSFRSLKLIVLQREKRSSLILNKILIDFLHCLLSSKKRRSLIIGKRFPGLCSIKQFKV